MNPSLTPLAVVNLLGVAQAILLAAALLSLRRKERAANRLLAALVAATALGVVGSVLYATRYMLVFPHAAAVFGTFNFVFGPLLFLYVRELTAPGARLGWKTLPHFLPALLCALYYLPLYLQGREAKLEYITRALQNYPTTEWRIKSLLIFFHVLIYLALAARMTVSALRRERGRDGAATNAASLAWVRNFVLMVLAIWAVGALRYLFAYDSRPETMMLLPLCFSIWVYVLGYVALTRPDALIGSDAVADQVAREDATRPSPVAQDDVATTRDAGAVTKKYARSSLTPERAERSLKKLLHVMSAERAYADSGLTLQKLAARLSLPANHLSQLINERLGQSFNDFVNSHRVREAQRLLADPAASHLSILGIAEEVGFNSKSTFNLVFKKQTGMTPSDFRKGQAAPSPSDEPTALAASH